jgi:hypothetical protein
MSPVTIISTEVNVSPDIVVNLDADANPDADAGVTWIPASFPLVLPRVRLQPNQF